MYVKTLCAFHEITVLFLLVFYVQVYLIPSHRVHIKMMKMVAYST